MRALWFWVRVGIAVWFLCGCASTRPEYIVQSLAMDPATVCAVASHKLLWGIYSLEVFFGRTNRAGGHIQCSPESLTVDDRAQ